jgi:hypothetical protein
LSGAFTGTNSSTGNIYFPNSSLKPNTSSITIPNQFTGTGVGGAIPLTALGATVEVLTLLSTETRSGQTIVHTMLSTITESGGSAVASGTSGNSASQGTANSNSKSSAIGLGFHSSSLIWYGICVFLGLFAFL